MTTEVKRFTCNLCDALCGLRVTVEDEKRIVEIRGDADDVLSHGHICPKSLALRELHEDPDRLRSPMRRTATGWEPIDWNTALSEAGARLRAVQKTHGRDAVAMYIGNPTAHSHRTALGSEVLSTALGTRNKYDANSQDSNPRLFACMQVYGDALTVPVPDLERIDYLLMMGANPAASNGSMMVMGDPRGRFKAIRARGGRIVLIDPRKTESAAWCDEHHFIRPGGDAAFLLALLNVLFGDKRIDRAAVEAQATGLAKLETLASKFTPERVAPVIGIEASRIRTIADELAGTPRAAVYARVGVCQNEFGPVANWLVEAVNIVTRHIDREGCAMFPTPAADIGPIGRVVVGNQYARWKSRVRGLPEFLGAFPSAVLAEEMETPGKGQIRAFVSLAGNPVLSIPNGDRLGRALDTLDTVVSIDYYINETSRHAHIILPPSHVFESGNYDLLMYPFAVHNVAKYSPPILAHPPDSRDDWEILTALAAHMKLPKWPRLRNWLVRLIAKLPETVIDLLLRFGAYKGLRLEELGRKDGGVDLGPLLPSGGKRFRTKDKKANLVPAPLVADVPRVEQWLEKQASMASGLVLIGRRHLRSNNSWMHNSRSLVKGPDRAQLMMNKSDAASLELADGSMVRVRSRVGEVEVKLLVTDDLMPGVVSLPHGYGHAIVADTLRIAGPLPGSSVNTLTDDGVTEPVVGNSILNGVPVTVERVGG